MHTAATAYKTMYLLLFLSASCLLTMLSQVQRVVMQSTMVHLRLRLPFWQRALWWSEPNWLRLPWRPRQTLFQPASAALLTAKDPLGS